jgi:ketosteroid isomerase-like protein
MSTLNQKIIQDFYAAFARRDGEAMGRFYHPEAVFDDPAFGELTAREAAAMWKMLCSRGKDLVVELVSSSAEGDHGRAHWDARYTFTKTGRPVHNVVHAEFTFKDSLIVRHHDVFDFWRWSSMALGLPGKLLGWSPLIKNAVRKEARRSLDAYLTRGA